MYMHEIKNRRAARRNALAVGLTGLGATVILAAGGYGYRLAGLFLLAAGFLSQKRVQSLRIKALTDYLEQANTGNAPVLSALGEDAFSRLEDQIYKTVTYLYQTREEAVRSKNEFAKNLSNIAHQIKTPIAVISLCVQTMDTQDEGGREQIRRQLMRLTHLEEALLLLARLDAGTLVLKREETDVYTMLMLAADNLQEIFGQLGVSVAIPELGETTVKVDLEWTMEAVMNLMKNCAEYNAGGCVHCSWGNNPLYTEILIWDEGAGFDREDAPRLFERFYRGKNAGEGGIGIGLALAKEIIERQNGTIRAKNLPEGGACFAIRFYRH
ncbi:MAG: HAMP domain-containing histidine kinase [Lachnospiraceae bacterium]|nr:HAMP domain-containing histidine kinase [Lachnospiraceae bacterium]